MSNLPAEFTNLKPVRKNQRYHTYRAQYNGITVFIKQVNAPSLANGIRRELWGIGAFSQLADGNNLGFMVPEVITSGTDYVVTSWAEGEPIELSPDAGTYKTSIEFFASSLAKIDMLTTLSNTLTPRFSLASKDIRSSIGILQSRLDQTDYSTFFDPSLIVKGFEYTFGNLDTLTARLTHADFTPGNVLEHNGQKTLIDYESVSLLWPRFYDLVNLTYNRMIMKPHLAPGCSSLVERYFEINKSVDLESVIPQLNVLAMVRSLSLIWEHLSQPNEYHNTQENMTPDLSERIAFNIERLLAGKPYFEISTS